MRLSLTSFVDWLYNTLLFPRSKQSIDHTLNHNEHVEDPHSPDPKQNQALFEEQHLTTWSSMRSAALKEAKIETAHMPSSEAATVKTEKAKKTEKLFAVSPKHQQKLAALKRLRDLPVGMNVDGRSAAILSILEDNSYLFAAVRAIRWPDIVRCPRCNSEHVKRRDPPPDALMPDQWYYTCLNCQSMGSPAEFEDITDLALSDNLEQIRQWMACYYLAAFCAPGQLTKILGVTGDILIALMFISKDLESKVKNEIKFKKETEEKRNVEKKKRLNKAKTTK